MKNPNAHQIDDLPFKQDHFFKKSHKSRYQSIDEEWGAKEGKNNLKRIAEASWGDRHNKGEIEED